MKSKNNEKSNEKLDDRCFRANPEELPLSRSFFDLQLPALLQIVGTNCKKLGIG
jgi:hypothetical protein